MKNVIEIGSYGRNNEKYWHQTWKKNGVNKILLQPISLDDENAMIHFNATPVYVIKKGMSYTSYKKTIEKYFSASRLFFNLLYKVSYARILTNSIILKKQINTIEKKLNIDAVIVHYSYGLETPFFHNTNKTFFYIHGLYTQNWGWGSTFKNTVSKFLLRNKRIIACSHAVYRDFLSTKIKTKSCDYVLNGISTENAREMAEVPLPNEYKNTDYITTVCRFGIEKQIPKMIEAYVQSKISAKFIIIGNGNGGAEDDTKNIKETIERLKCEDSVILYGRDNNPFRWFKNAKFSVIFSTQEGAARTIPESLAVKTPVVMSNQGGCPEYYKDHEELQKYIIDYKDAVSLAGAMKAMYDSPITINKQLSEQHNYEHHIQSIIDVLKDKKVF